MRRTSQATFTCLLGVLLDATGADGRTIDVTPTDSYDKIENAVAGDEVVIAPGTYKFRVYLEAQASPTQPIVIRAADPKNRPVWDLSETPVENAPGSYTAGDRGRGCWQFSGAAYVQVSGLVIKGCHTAGNNSAGVRYYNGSTGITLRDMLFTDNDNGLTGGSEQSDITVEFSEFDSNGNLAATAPSHNIYVYGGVFTLRYSYVHDPIQAQNFHLRATQALVEYNWFARAKSYQGDLMTSDDYDGSGTLTQNLTFRGNVVVQGEQANSSQIIAVYNDAGAAGLTLNVDASYNTFIGNGGRAGFVHLSNADGTSMSAKLTNNILFGTTRPAYAEDPSGTISGSHNWLLSSADPAGLTESITGTEPGFKDPIASDYTLAGASSCIGAADTTASLPPGQEYYENETTTCAYRVRNSAKDLGAFESTTAGNALDAYGNTASSAAGGYGGSAAVAGGQANAGGLNAAGTNGSTSGGTASVDSTVQANERRDNGGCGCRFPRSTKGGFPISVLAALGLGCAARRRTLQRSQRRVRARGRRGPKCLQNICKTLGISRVW